MTVRTNRPVSMDMEEALRVLEDETVIGIDLETSGLSPWKDKIAVVSMFGEESQRVFVLHVRGRLPKPLRDFLSEPGRLFVTHNGCGFDIPFLAANGVDYRGPRYFDTLIGEAVMPSASRRDVKKNLQATLNRRLKVSIKKTKGMSTSPWMAVELDPDQVDYCAEDIQYLPGLMNEHWAKVGQGREKEALTFETALIPITVDMIMNGLPLDQPMLERYRAELWTKMHGAHLLPDEIGPVMPSLEVQLKAALGDINLGSHLQLKKAFLQNFGMELESTDYEHLSILSEGFQEVNKVATTLLEWKGASKRYTMYDEGWVGKYMSADGRVRARFWQVGTETGRFSSSEPNLQQIPKDGRKMFGGELGRSIVSTDYSQLELRVAAALSGEEQMMEDMETGDIHTTVAASIYKCDVSEVTKEQRRIAKAASFTLIFGGSAGGLVNYARQNGSKLTYSEATMIVNGFFQRYRLLERSRMHAQTVANNSRIVPITLPTGMRRILHNPPPTQILNTSVQGTAAAGLKYAMFECERQGLTKYIGAVVHDEVVACVPNNEAEDFRVALEEAMVKGMNEVIDVKVGVESRISRNWG